MANLTARAILTRRGEGSESVALLFGHGAPQITAVLAVLKTGKFSVVLDPSYPAVRTKYMLEDSHASIILTDNQNLPLARDLAPPGCALINIDEGRIHSFEQWIRPSHVYRRNCNSDIGDLLVSAAFGQALFNQL